MHKDTCSETVGGLCESQDLGCRVGCLRIGGGGGRLWDLRAWASGYVGLGSFFCPFSNPSHFLPPASREGKNGGNSSYNGTSFLHSLLTKGTVSTSYPGTRGMLSAHSLDCRNSQGFVQTEDRQKLFFWSYNNHYYYYYYYWSLFGYLGLLISQVIRKHAYST